MQKKLFFGILLFTNTIIHCNETKPNIKKPKDIWVCALETIHERAYLILVVTNYLKYKSPSIKRYQLNDFKKAWNISNWPESEALFLYSLLDFLWEVPVVTFIEGVLIRYLTRKTLNKYHTSQ